MLTRLGQQSGCVTYALSNMMPLSTISRLTTGIRASWSARMSSVTMNTMFGADDGGSTVKSTAEQSVPASVATQIGPVVAPSGTTAEIDPSPSTVKPSGPADEPLNVTSEAPMNEEPEIVTGAPGEPCSGATAETTGDEGAVTVKGALAQPGPATLTTQRSPELAPDGTTADSDASSATVKPPLPTLTPPNVTSVALANPE